MMQGNKEEAIRLSMQYLNASTVVDVLTIRHKIKSYVQLGSIFQKIKEFPRAFEFYEKACQLSEQEYGIDCVQSIDIYKNLGSIYIETNKLKEADRFIQKALRICQTIYGENNVYTAETYR